MGQKYHCQQAGQPAEESLKLETLGGKSCRVADMEGETARSTEYDKRQPTATVYTQKNEC